jgi:hypothetical protein
MGSVIRNVGRIVNNRISPASVGWFSQGKVKIYPGGRKMIILNEIRLLSGAQRNATLRQPVDMDYE